MRPITFAVAAFALYASVTRCVAQEPSPVIYLSTAEAAKAKQAAQDLKNAQDRDSRAATAWRNFNQSFHAAHPELPYVRFVADFRVAFAYAPASSQFPLSDELATVDLSPEDRQKAESQHWEMEDAKRAHEQAEKTWSEFWHQLVLDHAPPTGAYTGSPGDLPGGKVATIPYPWYGGVVFTSDFKVVVPRSY